MYVGPCTWRDLSRAFRGDRGRRTLLALTPDADPTHEHPHAATTHMVVWNTGFAICIIWPPCPATVTTTPSALPPVGIVKECGPAPLPISGLLQCKCTIQINAFPSLNTCFVKVQRPDAPSRDQENPGQQPDIRHA